MDHEITLTLTPHEVNVILNALAELPYKRSGFIIDHIKQQLEVENVPA